MPERIQRRRTPGWQMPEGAVYVGRPGPFGNPYDWREWTPHCSAGWARAHVVDLYRTWLLGQPANALAAIPPTLERIRTELRGRDLACWCPLDGHPCHADVLLELANG